MRLFGLSKLLWLLVGKTKGNCHRFALASGPGVHVLPSYGIVIVIIFVLPLQRVSAGVLRRHVGGDKDVLGANQRWIDEDVGDSRCGGCGYGGERNHESLTFTLWFSTLRFKATKRFI